MDLDGVMEVEDCFALPGGETGLGREFVHFDLQVRSDGRCGRVGGLVRGEYEASVQGDCKERVNWWFSGAGRGWSGRRMMEKPSRRARKMLAQMEGTVSETCAVEVQGATTCLPA